MNKITKRQQEVLKFIGDYINKTGFSPTAKDLCDNFGWKSPNAGSEYFLKLTKKGYLYNMGTHRGYRLAKSE